MTGCNNLHKLLLAFTITVVFCTHADAGEKFYMPFYCGDGIVQRPDENDPDENWIGEICDDGDKIYTRPGDCSADCRYTNRMIAPSHIYLEYRLKGRNEVGCKMNAHDQNFNPGTISRFSGDAVCSHDISYAAYTEYANDGIPHDENPFRTYSGNETPSDVQHLKRMTIKPVDAQFGWSGWIACEYFRPDQPEFGARSNQGWWYCGDTLYGSSWCQHEMLDLWCGFSDSVPPALFESNIHVISDGMERPIIWGTVTDSGEDSQGIDKVVFRFDPPSEPFKLHKGWTKIPTCGVDTLGMTAKFMVVTPLNVSNGQHTVQFAALDKAGNMSGIISKTVAVNHDPALGSFPLTLQFDVSANSAFLTGMMSNPPYSKYTGSDSAKFGTPKQNLHLVKKSSNLSDWSEIKWSQNYPDNLAGTRTNTVGDDYSIVHIPPMCVR